MADRLENFWREGLKPLSPAAFGFGLFCFAAASLLRLALHLASPDVVPFATYFVAILASALIAGKHVAALVALLGALLSWWAFVPPFFTFHALTVGQAISFLIYAVSSATIIFAAGLYRSMVQQIRDEENYRKVVVDELEHRVKNKLATIYAILNRSLKEQPDIWKDVSGRLKALAATDEFVSRMDERGVPLRSLLDMELTPYDKSRALLDGPDVRCPGKLATSVALIFHELATNAAKYGALSNDEGRLEISWTAEGRRIEVGWKETGGPEVAPPTHRGFGTFLSQRALGPFQGEVQMRFEREGLLCNIAFSLPA